MIENLENEIWKDIKGYEGLYQVSNLGRVKSLKRNSRLFDKLIMGGVNSCGYRIVFLIKDKIRKTVSVHRIVGETFIENTMFNKCINHINGIKIDNIVSNLEWVTQRENIHHYHCVLQSKHNVNMGVRQLRKKWTARYYINGKNNYLGVFETKEDAQKEYYNFIKSGVNNYRKEDKTLKIITLVDIRKDKKIKQQAVALSTGISQQQLSKLEKIGVNINAKAAALLSNYYGMDLKEMYIYKKK